MRRLLAILLFALVPVLTGPTIVVKGPVVHAAAAATIAFRSASHSAGTATNITVTEPAGAVADDILLAVAGCAGAGTLGAPAGWTVISSGTDAYDGFFEYNFAWIRRTGSAPSLTWTTGSSVYREVRILCISGAVTSGTPYEADAGAQGTVSNPNPPSVTTLTANALVVALFYYSGGSDPSWTAPSGYTFHGDNTIANQTGAGSKLVASPGAEDPGIFINSLQDSNWRSHTVSLKDAP